MRSTIHLVIVRSPPRGASLAPQRLFALRQVVPDVAGTTRDHSVTRHSAPAPIVRRAPLFNVRRAAYPMAMPASAGNWTVAMLEALPDDGQRYEIIDGELYVTPSPRVRHQHVVAELVALLVPYVKRAGGAIVLMSPSDVRKGDRTSVQPDVFVVRLSDEGRVAVPINVRDLFLAIEVLSDRTARTDRQDKRWLYQGEEVAEYWIVDADAWVFERWRPGDDRPEVLSDEMRWRCTGAAEPLVIALPAFFAALVPD